MKNKSIILFLMLCLSSCSSIHYTTDINKVRDKYNEKKYTKEEYDKKKIKIDENQQDNLSELDRMARQRVAAILNKDTMISPKIACLSTYYKGFAIDVRNNLRQKAKDKLISLGSSIQKYKDDLYKIDNGGYRTARKSSSGKISGKKIYRYGIYDLATKIKVLDIENIKATTNEKHLSHKTKRNFEKFDRMNRELAELKSARKRIEQTLKKLEAERNFYLNAYKTKESSEGFDPSKIGTRFSVSNIYDKTSKVYSLEAKSTALSDMVEHALSYNNSIVVVNTPYGERVTESRYDPFNNGSNVKGFVSKNKSPLQNNFTGTLFPSDIFLSGALVQYDDDPPIKPFGTRLGVDIDPLNISSSTKTITIGFVLRAIDSNNSLLVDYSKLKSNENNNKSLKASVYIQNTFFIKKISADLFEVKSDRLYGGDFKVEVADPIQYAVREMVEEATYQILKKTLMPNYQRQANTCDNV